MRRAAVLLLLAACGGAIAPAPARPAAPASAAPPAAAPAAAAPAPAADTAPVTDGDVTEAWLQGMHILVKRVPRAELVAVQLYVRGGVRNWAAGDAGVEQLALAVSASGGTERLAKDAFTRRLADLGSALGAVSTNDFAALTAKSLLPAWAETFDLLVDAFRHPALPPSEIELVRAQLLAGLRHEEEVPDARLGLLAHQTLFKGHPYERRAAGTIETVTALDREKLRAHLGKLRETSRLLLVVVGDVDPAQVLERARAGLGDLPRGRYEEPPLPPWAPTRAAVTVLERKLPTSYILSVFPAPAWSDPEFPVALVAMRLLGEREFEEVRTKRNLSYAPSAGLNPGSALPRGQLSVTAVDPDKTMAVMLGEARRLRSEAAPEKELAGVKAMSATIYFLQAETTDGQAALLARWQIYGGDWRGLRALPERMRAVTAAQIQAFAGRITRLQTFVLGDPPHLDRAQLEAL